MGLDTHDYGVLTEPAPIWFSVELGYPAEGFGIRLEDDLVIQESGEPFNLMRNIPIEADEIESLMN
jgi:Xaa-Pro aminopeptidase